MYIKFSSGSNCICGNVNGLLMGVINNVYLDYTFFTNNTLEYYNTPRKNGEELKYDSIKYTLYEKPNNFIEVKICI